LLPVWVLWMSACAPSSDGIDSAAAGLLVYPSHARDGVELANYDSNPITGIHYAGGGVMTGTTTVYLVFYGSFTSARMQLMKDFVSGIGGSPLANVLTTFFDGNGDAPSGYITGISYGPLAKSQGNSLDPTKIGSIIQSLGPVDENGIYV